MQGMMKDLSLEVKRLWLEADNSPPFSDLRFYVMLLN
jgi:hypothetical protein